MEVRASDANMHEIKTVAGFINYKVVCSFILLILQDTIPVTKQFATSLLTCKWTTLIIKM